MRLSVVIFNFCHTCPAPDGAGSVPCLWDVFIFRFRFPGKRLSVTIFNFCHNVRLPMRPVLSTGSGMCLSFDFDSGIKRLSVFICDAFQNCPAPDAAGSVHRLLMYLSFDFDSQVKRLSVTHKISLYLRNPLVKIYLSYHAAHIQKRPGQALHAARLRHLYF